jgi:hypothetical protein
MKLDVSTTLTKLQQQVANASLTQLSWISSEAKEHATSLVASNITIQVVQIRLIRT